MNVEGNVTVVTVVTVVFADAAYAEWACEGDAQVNVTLVTVVGVDFQLYNWIDEDERKCCSLLQNVTIWATVTFVNELLEGVEGHIVTMLQ